MFAILPILALIVLLLINRYIMAKSYKILNPLSLMIYVWILVFVFHAILFSVKEFTFFTYMLILVGIYSFAVGFWTMKHVNINSLAYNETYNLVRLRKMLNFFTVIEIFRLLYMVFIILKIAGSFSVFIHSNTYVRYLYLDRQTRIYESIFEFIIGATCMIGVSIVGIYWVKHGKNRNLYLFFWITIELLSALITMSKMSFILSVIVLLISILNNIGNMTAQKKFIVKYLPLIGACMFGFLMIIGLQRNYTAILDGSLFEIVIRKAGLYLTGGTEALSIYIKEHESSLDLGKNSFRFIYRVFARLEILENSGVLQHAETIEIESGVTNVYTWFIDFYKDFSYIGFYVISMFLGNIVGIFYIPDKHNLFLDISIPWISVIVIMSFYAFLWKQTIYIFVIIYAYIIHRIMSKRIRI